ncbi:MAG TPA: hypothetical protein VG675_19570 [Bryobacteraceae bacterium]|nr:hypothetical protein [Bryobacteraceae bacterium]
MDRILLQLVRGILCAALSLWAGPLYGQCSLARGAQAALANLEGLAGQPGYAFRKAGIYLDSGCYAEARVWFVRARDNVPQDQDDRQQALNAINGSIELVDAAGKLRAGHRDEAAADLKHILQTYGLMAVTPRAAVALATLIVTDPNPQIWQVVEEPLRQMADEGWSMWRPKLLLVEHQINAEGTRAAIATLSSNLAQEIPTQRRLMLQVLMAHALRRAGRVTEAAVLLTNIEDEVGENSLDADLRIFYLNLCVDIWQQRSQAGTDPSAAARLNAFQSALRDTAAQR